LPAGHFPALPARRPRLILAAVHELSRDTIAAIATATGGGLGILRLSGPDAISIGQRCFSTRFTDTPRRLVFGTFFDPQTPDQPLDDGLAVAFIAPHSFTGEPIVELHLHGGALHLTRCLEVLLAEGARPAEPGEFSRRAFLNGKLDLTRAEAIADLVAAQTDHALRHARAHLQGALHTRVTTLRDALLDLRARLEVNVDFVDEDIPIFDATTLAATANTLGYDLAALADTFHSARRLRDGATVVLAGPPNAGKSSLFNALVDADRAIVTPIAGTTRDALREYLDIRGIPVTLIDTAGLRDTDDAVERIGVSRTHLAMADADLVVYLLAPDLPDPNPANPSNREGQGATPTNDLDRAPGKTLFVHSKADLPDTHTSPKYLDHQTSRPSSHPLRVSATTGLGLDALKDAIAEHLGGLPSDDLVIVRERQHLALKAASQAILRAAAGLSANLSPELPAVDLQDAMDELDQLVGHATIEDVLDRLFSTFCIGK
jgi:tRNA modification GTPase